MPLARRRRFVALTLTCLGMAVAATAVGVAMPWADDVAPASQANLSPIETRVNEVRSKTIDFTMRCMLDAGFRAFSTAHELSGLEEVQWIERSMVYWHPLESGPIDEAQAVTFGLVGTSLIFQEPVPAAVTGDDDDYLAALRGCDQELDERADVDVRGLLDDWSLLWERVRRHFTELAAAEADPLLHRLYDCWLPRIGVEPTDDAHIDSYPDLLRDLGIEEGQYVIPRGSAGEIAGDHGLVLTPRPRGEYRPTRDEVAIALEFARCAKSTEFAQRLIDAQQAPAEATLREFDAELEEMGERIDHVLAAVSDC